MGAISVEDGDVYLGNGTGRDRIGSLDETYNGQDGQPLRILFSSPLPNAGFEEGAANWSIQNQEYGDNGNELNLDALRVTLASDTDYRGGTGTVNIQDPNGMSWNGSVQAGQGVDSSQALYLGSNGSIASGDQNPPGSFQPDGYGSIHGPYATSSVISVQAGDNITLDFRAVGSGDDYEVFGFLRRVDADGNFISNDVNNTTDNILLFAQRGNDTGGWVNISEENLPAGNYRFEFVGGTYDGSGGLVVGSNLYVDNIRLVSATTVNDTVAQTIARQVAYQNDAEDAPLNRQITVTAVDSNGTSGTSSTGLTFVSENDSPTLSDTVLSPVNEDTLPVGETVASIFTPVFDDPDNGFSPTDSLAGVVISGNAATADQGEWQYSTNGTDWYAIGTVSANNGLVLSDSSLIRFLPAADWNGTPGSLTAHAVDSTYEGDFTQEGVRAVFDTNSDSATSPVSANGASASITVISVNDAPVFTSAAQQLSVADSEANDTSAALTGTIAASDLHDGAPGENSVITYGIIDGTAADGIATRTDAYGTLSLDQASGTYSFLPDAEALNALAEGQEVVRSFTVTASDGQGGVTQQTLTVTLTGANDAPVAQGHSGTAVEAAGINNDIAGSPASGSVLGGVSGDFDPDTGDTVSLSGVRTGGLSDTGADGTWSQDVVTLSGTYGTLTMQADGSWTYAPDETNAAVNGLTSPSDTLSEVFTYTITDASGLTSSAELTVTIEGRNDALNVSGNIDAELVAPEDTDRNIDLSGLTFEDPDLGGEVYDIVVSAQSGSLWTEDFPGLTISGNGTEELVLSGSATDLGQWMAANDLAYRSPIDGAAGSDTVTLAYATAGETTRTPLGNVDVTITETNDPAIIDTNGSSLVQGDETTAESSVITFLPTADAQVLNFDGISLVIDAASTAEEIAEAFAAQSRPNWVAVHEGNGRVVLTATAPGNRPDLTADDFTDANGNISDVVGTSGGFDGQARFTARGEAVAILSNLELTDADSDTMSGATISMVEGLLDNRFGVVHESLSLTEGAQALAASHGINVTITTSAAAGSSVVLTGEASAEVYESILQGVLYNNTNPNAVAGSRQVQVEVTDAEGQVSNLSAVALTEGNDAIAVGQRIYIDGEDSGQVVAAVRDARSFVASGPLAGLDEGATLSFRDASGLVTTAISANDGRASVTVDVIWAPVIDMNGPQQGGDIHRISYLEQQAPVAIATADARVEDQEGLIRTLDVELTNPLDNTADQAPEEYLGVRKAVLDLLAARGITLGDHNGTMDASGNLTGATRISFEAPGGSTATNFQIALRGVTYANMDDAPTAATRIVTAQATDMSGNVGLLTHTEINPQAVNDAPVGIDSNVTGSEDVEHVFSVEDFGFSDPLDEGANQLASITITSLPTDGQLLLNGQEITVGTIVSRADLEGGALVYAPPADANGSDLARFGFRVTDNGGTANGGRNTDTTDRIMVINVDPVNDAPVLVPGTSMGSTLTEDDIDNSGNLVSDLLGSVSDVDGSVTPGMAVHGVASEGPGGGQWQYRLDGGSWTNITLSEGEVLLLGANDAVRFVPDQQNATEAQLSYYAWDGTDGIAGTVVAGIAGSDNAANRGGNSGFSVDSADVSIEVTAVNDNPSIEVGQGNTFYARGAAVALFGTEELVLTDPDEGAALTQAVVTLDPETTTDNVFGTLYETIFSTGGASFTTSGGTQLTITGTGLAGDPIVISGTGSLEDYQEALQSLRYENANPNLFTGERSISLRVTDETGAISQETSFDLAVEWATVADLNGPSSEGRDHTTTYVEGGVGVAIATADAELIDEEGNTVEVVVTLEDGVNGTDERLIVDPAMLNALAALNITVLGNGTHEIRLQNLDGLDQTYFQLALRAIRYVNDSSAPTDAARHVTVTSTDSEGNPGVAATTTIGIEQVNDAPVSTLSISHPGSGTRTPFVGETLTLTGMVTDADGFPGLAGAQVEWLRNGTVIATGLEYVLSAADTGQAVSARLVYTDREGNAELIDIATPGIAGLHLVGGNADDGLSGSIGNDSLEGGAGRDTLAGGVGNDTLVGGADADTASYQSATSGVTVDLNLQGVAQLVGASEGSDTLISIENLIGSRFEDLLTGDAVANVVSGGAGNDTIRGEAGNDMLFGNQGDDLLEGGSGDDWMHGGRTPTNCMAVKAVIPWAAGLVMIRWMAGSTLILQPMKPRFRV
ncbi:beta strand repeat-containing protein [Paracoccus aerius]|uniref:beta strand repeat-containing protein n=1 Tax=Paracoccus aerius TaxID=1915382 RepID=UPI0036139C61